VGYLFLFILAFSLYTDREVTVVPEQCPGCFKLSRYSGTGANDMIIGPRVSGGPLRFRGIGGPRRPREEARRGRSRMNKSRSPFDLQLNAGRVGLHSRDSSASVPRRSLL
jgi:hypothetical protein